MQYMLQKRSSLPQVFLLWLSYWQQGKSGYYRFSYCKCCTANEEKVVIANLSILIVVTTTKKNKWFIIDLCTVVILKIKKSVTQHILPHTF